MEIEFSRDDIVVWLSRLTRTTIDQDGSRYEFSLEARGEEHRLATEFAELDSLVNRLGLLDFDGETGLLTTNSYEIPVREEGPFLLRHRIIPPDPDPNTCVDADSGVTYELSMVSNEYVIFFLSQMSQQGLLKDFRRLPPGIIGMKLKELGNPTVMDLAKLCLQLYSLKIESSDAVKSARFRSLANSYCFQASYNADAALVPIRLLQDVSRGARILRVRKANPDDIEPPRRIYEEDLIHYYLQGVSAESLLMQYLSYYHIAEHFFEKIFQQDVIQRVRRKITQPGFSYSRDRDIAKLVKLISESYGIRDQEITFNEQEALKLTLLEYVTLEELCSELDAYDDTLVEFYDQSPVKFSDGDSVDLRNTDQQIAYTKLASRIYRTRNSLVHSKEGAKKRFVPFRDDHALVREVPLVRFIAEAIIVESSKLM